MQISPQGARGVLYPQLAHGEFKHERLLPSALLADLVEHYWYVQWDLSGLPAQRQATLPHPNVHLVIERGEARVYGVHTERFERVLEGRDFAFGIKFKPGGFQPFLRAPVSTLANGHLAAAGIVAGANELLLCPQVEDMPARAEALLLAALPAVDADVKRVNQIVHLIASDLSLTSVDQVLAVAGIDKRTLQRLFQKYVGIGPKWVIKRYRLHEAIARVQAGEAANWAALALELGYFDQAHFVRDFRALVGQTPGEYQRTLSAAK